ncbi:MAG: SRPBCC family protein [Bacteroidetes bacterium]|nr:SRPBCC family protein [Bacteroidota bacterium]
MKALKIVGGIIVLLILVLVVLGLIAPKDSAVEKKVTINAPADLVYAQVAKFENFIAWSPWNSKDPNMETKRNEVADGEVGATYEWKGNEEVGEGKQEITKAEPNTRVEHQLTFKIPMGEATPTSYFNIEDKGEEGVELAWGFNSTSPFPWNAFNLFMDMETSVGNDYETGLAALKTRCEEMAAAAAAAEAEKEEKASTNYNVAASDFEGMSFVGVQGEKISDFEAFYTSSFQKVGAAMGKLGLKPLTSAAGCITEWYQEEMAADMIAGWGFKTGTRIPGLQFNDIPACTKLTIDYYGEYDKVQPAHDAMDNYMKANGYTMAGPVVEEYITDPAEAEGDWSKVLTKIHYFANKSEK